MLVALPMAVAWQTGAARTWLVDSPGVAYRAVLPMKWVPDRLVKPSVAGSDFFHAADGQNLMLGYTAHAPKSLLNGFLDVAPSMKKPHVEIKSRKFMRDGWQGYVVTFRRDTESGLNVKLFQNSIAAAMVRGTEVRVAEVRSGKEGRLPSESEVIWLCESLGP